MASSDLIVIADPLDRCQAPAGATQSNATTYNPWTAEPITARKAVEKTPGTVPGVFPSNATV